MEQLEINGIIMPPIAYNGATKSRNKIWSRNTGRNSNGDMVGTIIAIKTKWEFTFVPLSEDEVDKVESAISNIANSYVPVKFTRNSGKVEQFTAYSGDITYPLLWDTKRMTLYQGVKVSLIEQ